METVKNPKIDESATAKIRRSVKILKNLSFEDRLQLLVRAGLMTQVEANQKLELSRAKL
jgi:hypothetical protein